MNEAKKVRKKEEDNESGEARKGGRKKDRKPLLSLKTIHKHCA